MMLEDIVTSIVKVLYRLAVLTFCMRISSKTNIVCNYAALEIKFLMRTTGFVFIFVSTMIDLRVPYAAPLNYIYLQEESTSDILC